MDCEFIHICIKVLSSKKLEQRKIARVRQQLWRHSPVVRQSWMCMSAGSSPRRTASEPESVPAWRTVSWACWCQLESWVIFALCEEIWDRRNKGATFAGMLRSSSLTSCPSTLCTWSLNEMAKFWSARLCPGFKPSGVWPDTISCIRKDKRMLKCSNARSHAVCIAQQGSIAARIECTDCMQSFLMTPAMCLDAASWRELWSVWTKCMWWFACREQILTVWFAELNFLSVGSQLPPRTLNH